MIDNDKKQDPALDAEVEREMAKEMEGVPEHLRDDGGSDEEEAGENLSDLIAQMKSDLEAAKQETLYAKADTQNVRRRLEKDIQDARAYAATGFARDILSVSDNLARAIDSIPQDLREDDKFKGLVAGIEATQRELDKVFGQHGVTRIAAMGMPLDPNEHQAMMEIPTGDAEPGTIVQEMQAGYKIKDRLLRPAMVGVAKKPD